MPSRPNTCSREKLCFTLVKSTLFGYNIVEVTTNMLNLMIPDFYSCKWKNEDKQ